MSGTSVKALAPNPQAEAIPNLVPGAEILGYGFNIFGQYSFDSAIQPLFDLGAKYSPYTYPESGTVYNVPSNVSPPGGSSASASAYAFSTSTEFVRQFQADASVSGSIGAFSASFTSAYSAQQQESSQYSWALVEGKYYAWHLQMLYSTSTILPQISSDPDWSNLPGTFTPDNAALFYAFFQKFGTHFISGVACGGTLYYYFAIQKQANYSSNQISASVSAEYQGLISSTQAQANAYWSQTSNQWTNFRQSYAVTVPATTGVIDWINPPAGSYDSTQQFANWKTSVTNNPSRANFSLTPIHTLFSGAQAIALQQAYAAYGSNRVHVESYRDRVATVLVNGTPVVPPGGYPTNQGAGWHVILLDSRNNSVVFNRYYDIEFGMPNWPDGTNQQISSDLTPYLGTNNYILVLAGCKMNEGANPNNTLYGILKSFGAGAGLDAWMQREHGCAGGNGVAYALVGLGTSVNACEAFTDVYMPPFSQADVVVVDAFLQPTAGHFTPVPFQPS